MLEVIFIELKIRSTRDKEEMDKNTGIKIEIQCPNCGDVIKINPERKYLCRSCDHIFTENEIREKCGL